MDSDAYARRWELVTQHRERLLPVALARCASRADAEDAVHEAMVRAVTYADLDETRLRAFLTTVTVRLCIDQHRRRERDLRAGTAVFHGDVDDLGPEPEACDRAEAEWVASVLATLPERQREVVEVRASGADLAETARRLHLSYRAVESALARARTQVRAAMLAGTAAVAGALVAAGTALARRARWAAAPAAAMTAVGFTTAVLVLGAPPSPDGGPRALPEVRAPRVDAPYVSAAAPRGPGPGTARDAAPAAAAAPEGAPPRPRAQAGPGAAKGDDVVRVPGPGGRDVAVTAHDTDETTAEMVERCATGGYTIENGSGRCTKQEDDPGAYPVSDAIRDLLPPKTTHEEGTP